jgi:aspartate-semialdehyde dehydrogenase
MQKQVIALVGATSLLGREFRDVAFKGPERPEIHMVGAEDEEEGTLIEHEGEPVVLTGLDAEHLREAGCVVLAGSPESARKALDILSREAGASPAIVDLTFAMEGDPRARLRAPGLEPALRDITGDSVHLVAHPAALMVGALFFQLRQSGNPMRRAVVQIFEPASERGRKGVAELQDQTVSLLSFQALPRQIFDEQLSFNLLSRYGSDAGAQLQDVEQRVERHLATLLSWGEGLPMPSLRLIQAPVFNGYSVSLWVEFERPPETGFLEAAFQAAGIDVRGSGTEGPTVVGSAGEPGIIAEILPDRNCRTAVWVWAVADNIRLSAEAAVTVARSALAEKGRLPS